MFNPSRLAAREAVIIDHLISKRSQDILENMRYKHSNGDREGDSLTVGKEESTIVAEALQSIHQTSRTAPQHQATTPIVPKVHAFPLSHATQNRRAALPVIAPAMPVVNHHQLLSAQTPQMHLQFVQMQAPGRILRNTSAVPDVFQGRKKRSGKWTPEEEKYADLLIEQFEKGQVDEYNGSTLRSFLSRKLHCAPMRISKKFAGKGIGKQVYLSKNNMVHFDAALFSSEMSRLREAEMKFLKGIYPEIEMKPTSHLPVTSMLTPLVPAPLMAPLRPCAQLNGCHMQQLQQSSNAQARAALVNHNNWSQQIQSLGAQTHQNVGIKQCNTAKTTNSTLQQQHAAKRNLDEQNHSQGAHSYSSAHTHHSNNQLSLQEAYMKIIQNEAREKQVPQLQTHAQHLYQAKAPLYSQLPTVAQEHQIQPLSSTQLLQHTNSLVHPNSQPLTEGPEQPQPRLHQLPSNPRTQPESVANTLVSKQARDLHQVYLSAAKTAAPLCTSVSNEASITLQAIPSLTSGATTSHTPSLNKVETQDASPGAIPDFLSGFDRVTGRKSDSTGIATAVEENVEHTPTFTSKSFDDFHRYLGKHISPLVSSRRNNISSSSPPSLPVKETISASISSHVHLYPKLAKSNTTMSHQEYQNTWGAPCASPSPDIAPVEVKRTESTNSSLLVQAFNEALSAVPSDNTGTDFLKNPKSIMPNQFGPDVYSTFAQQSASAVSQHSAYMSPSSRQLPQQQQQWTHQYLNQQDYPDQYQPQFAQTPHFFNSSMVPSTSFRPMHNPNVISEPSATSDQGIDESDASPMEMFIAFGSDCQGSLNGVQSDNTSSNDSDEGTNSESSERCRKKARRSYCSTEKELKVGDIQYSGLLDCVSSKV